MQRHTRAKSQKYACHVPAGIKLALSCTVGHYGYYATSLSVCIPGQTATLRPCSPELPRMCAWVGGWVLQVLDMMARYYTDQVPCL